MSDWRPGDRRADRASMIRVDQAGEYGATRIYAGQLAVLRRNAPEAKLIARMAAQEERHLKRFDQLVAERRVRPTALQPLWNVAGFALGAATALISEKAALACTDAVETVIDRHYGQQLESSAKKIPSSPQTSPNSVPRRSSIATPRARPARPMHRLSVADRGDPCRLQDGNRAFKAHMRNRTAGFAR